ncbi:sensor histidine kinase [Bacillus nitroreducens]
MRLLKSQRHDMIFHLSSIQSMLSLKQYDALNKYLSKITNHVTSINSTLFMHSPAVSALLYSFQQKARNEDVSFDLTIKDDLKELPISEYDFNIIIGNLLQNAFEHVKNLDRKMRNISMTAESDVNHFFISISNTGIIDHLVLNKMFDVGFTTKKEENTRRGYGLFSVKKVVEQNNGIIYPEIMDHTITFNVVFDRAI